MDSILTIHALLGERVLPLLTIVAAVWFTITWKPQRERTLPGRLFTILISIQFVLGLLYWIYGLFLGRGDYLGWPFILHPVLGFFAVLVAHSAVSPRPTSPLARLGRWGPLVALLLLLVIITGSILTGYAI